MSFRLPRDKCPATLSFGNWFVERRHRLVTVGILAEKPSQARNFAKALCAKKGKLSGTFEGTFEGTPFIIAHALGHVVEFVKPEGNVPAEKRARYLSWKLDLLPWDESDFLWKYKVRGDTASVISTIGKAFANCDEVCIGTDDDPTGEGELLAWEALDAAKVKNKKWTRMYFADEAPESVKKAFRSRKKLQSKDTDGDYLKALYRSKWDYLSMQFTRIAYGCGDGRSTLRQGRLKSAMVVLVGDQLAKVAAYKKVPFYSARFKDENGVEYIDKEQKQYPKREDVPMGGFHASSVTKDSSQKKTTAPPKLMDLAALSARMAPKGYKAKQVLKIVQSLYENQHLSYPRTEDKFISNEQFDELLPLAPKIAKVVGVDPSLLTHTAKRKTHVKDGGAHGANRPGPNVPNSLAELDQKFGKGASIIYSILAKNYLAMLCEDYEYTREVGHVTDFPKFVGSANVPVKPGWRAVFDDEEKDADENAKGLGKKAEPFVHEGFPPKPANPTMRWLMKQLEKRDVGTGATRTSIYGDVTAAASATNRYPLMVDTRGRITFTQFGEMSYALLPGTHIGDLAMTEKLMHEMKLIAEGKFDPKDGFAEMAKYVADDLKTMAQNGEKMRAEKGIKLSSEKVSGKWQGKDVSINPVWANHTFSDDELKRLFAGETITITGCTPRGGGPEFAAKGKLDNLVFKGRKYVGFNMLERLTPDGSAPAPQKEKAEGDWTPIGKDGKKQKAKHVRFNRTWGGHTFTDDEVAKLLAGETIEVKGLTNAKGKEYGVKGLLANQTFKGRKYVGFKRTGWL